MATIVKVQLQDKETANAFFLWLSEGSALEEFNKSEWASYLKEKPAEIVTAEAGDNNISTDHHLIEIE